MGHGFLHTPNGDVNGMQESTMSPIQSEALLAVCRCRSPGITITFIGCEQEGPMDTGESHRTEKSVIDVWPPI